MSDEEYDKELKKRISEADFLNDYPALRKAIIRYYLEKGSNPYFKESKISDMDFSADDITGELQLLKKLCDILPNKDSVLLVNHNYLDPYISGNEIINSYFHIPGYYIIVDEKNGIIINFDYQLVMKVTATGQLHLSVIIIDNIYHAIGSGESMRIEKIAKKDAMEVLKKSGFSSLAYVLSLDGTDWICFDETEGR
jgi:hypothetical protein